MTEWTKKQRIDSPEWVKWTTIGQQVGIWVLTDWPRFQIKGEPTTQHTGMGDSSQLKASTIRIQKIDW